MAVAFATRHVTVQSRDISPSPTTNPTLIKFFVTCQMTTWLGLWIVLVTAWISPKIRRHSAWYGFCISWVLSGISYSLLTLAGLQSGPRLDFGLCLAQATLIYVAPTLTASTTLALVVHLWFNFNSMLSSETPNAARRRSFALVAFPYAISLVIFSIALRDGLSHADTIQRSYTGAYCVIGTGLPGKIVAAWAGLSMVATVGFQIHITVILYRNWRAIRGLGARSSQSLAMLIRVAVFSLFGVLAIVVCLVLFADPNSTLPDVLLAMIPMASLLTFGTQMDLLRAWMFWRNGNNNNDDTLVVVHEEGRRTDK